MDRSQRLKLRAAAAELQSCHYLAPEVLVTRSPARPTACPTVWQCLTVGIPITLLLDLAAGDSLDSAGVLHDEEVAALAAQAWAEALAGAGSAWAHAAPA